MMTEERFDLGTDEVGSPMVCSSGETAVGGTTRAR